MFNVQRTVVPNRLKDDRQFDLTYYSNCSHNVEFQKKGLGGNVGFEPTLLTFLHGILLGASNRWANFLCLILLEHGSGNDPEFHSGKSEIPQILTDCLTIKQYRTSRSASSNSANRTLI